MTIQIQELCSRLRQLYLPAVCDALYQLGLEEKVLPSYLRPLFPDDRMVGVAFTVEGRGIDPPVPWAEGIERMTSYLEVFERLPIDSVLVSVNHSSHVGHFGELTANAAQQRGCRGIVLDGNLRDIEGLRQIGFPGLLPRSLASQRDRSMGDDLFPAAGGDRWCDDRAGRHRFRRV